VGEEHAIDVDQPRGELMPPDRDILKREGIDMIDRRDLLPVQEVAQPEDLIELLRDRERDRDCDVRALGIEGDCATELEGRHDEARLGRRAEHGRRERRLNGAGIRPGAPAHQGDEPQDDPEASGY
jgi:hypothetical protein